MFSARRLVKAVDAKTDTAIPIMETRMRSVGHDAPFPVEVQTGSLKPDVLRKLRAKVIFSLRDDLIKEDRRRIAEIILGEDKK